MQSKLSRTEPEPEDAPAIQCRINIKSSDARPLLLCLIFSLIAISTIGKEISHATRLNFARGSCYPKLLTAPALPVLLPRENNLCTIFYNNVPNKIQKKIRYLNHSLQRCTVTYSVKEMLLSTVRQYLHAISKFSLFSELSGSSKER
jgi:hypothetical protein